VVPDGRCVSGPIIVMQATASSCRQATAVLRQRNPRALHLTLTGFASQLATSS